MRRHLSSALILLSAAISGASQSTATLAQAIPTAGPAAHPTSSRPAQKTAPVAKTAPAPSTAAPKPPAALLPSSFAGWESEPPRTVTDLAQVDPAAAAALKEFGFTDALLATYTRGNQSLTLKALRFNDASGAYGAYTYYRHSGWPKEQIGSGGTSDNNRILFWTGNVVVDAQVPHVSAMTASEFRELAAAIPTPNGNKALAPPLLANLPQKDMEGQSTHYAVGPASYSGSGGVLPPELVGFDRGAEAVTSTYKLRSGPATLTLIDYPTPQMATAQEKAITAYLKAGNSAAHPFTQPLQNSNPAALEVRRSGPILAIVSGDAIQDEAHKLLASVHYDADIASMPRQQVNEVQNFAKLLLGIIVLVVVMFLGALGVAIFLGGGRAAFRMLRGKPASTMHDESFTRLDLKD